VVSEHELIGTDVAFIPAASLDECKDLCKRHDFGGFFVTKGRAYFRADKGKALKSKLSGKTDCCAYIRDEKAQDMRFRFTTSEKGEKEMLLKRLYDWVSGRLTLELNANKEEVEDLQWRSHQYAQGICARSRRAYGSFRVAKNKGMGDGGIITFNQCATCSASSGNCGCIGCRRPFCLKCFAIHKGTAPGVTWMFQDAWLRAFTASPELCLEDAQDKMSELMETNPDRPICIRIIVEGKQIREESFDSALSAYDFLFEYQQEDQRDSPQPRTLVSFVANSRRAANKGSRATTCKGMSFAVSSMAGILEDSDEEEGASTFESNVPVEDDAHSRESCMSVQSFLGEL